MKFEQFKTPDGKDVLINLDQITVVHGGNANICTIKFSDERGVDVSSTFEKISEFLLKAHI